jgi:WD40 repeat protein
MNARLALLVGCLYLAALVERRSTVADDVRNQAQPAAGNRVDLYGDPLPAGAIARLGSMRLRHDTSLADHPVAFSPYGKILATGAPQSIRLWSTATGKLLLELRLDFPGRMLFSSDGKRLLVSTREATIRQYDVASGRLVGEITPTTRKPSGIYAMVMSPRGDRLAVIGQGFIGLHDLATGKEVMHLAGHERGGHDLAFSADGSSLISLGYDENIQEQVCHWDLKSGEKIKAVPMPWGAGGRATVRLSPDGQTVAVPLAGKVHLIDTATAKEDRVLKDQKGKVWYALAFTPDSRILAVGENADKIEDQVISLWDVGQGTLLRSFKIPYGSFVHFSPDGQTLLTDSSRRIGLWSARTGEQLLKQTGHEDGVTALVFMADSRVLLSAGHDHTLRRWEATTGRQLDEQKLNTGSAALALSPDGRRLYFGGRDGGLHIQDLESGTELHRLDPGVFADERKDPGHPVDSIYVSPDGKIAVTHHMYFIQSAANEYTALYGFRVWDVTVPRLISQRQTNRDNFKHFSADARRVAGNRQALGRLVPGAADPKAKSGSVLDPSNMSHALVEDVATGRTLVSIPQPDIGGSRFAFSPDGQTLVGVTSKRHAIGEETQTLRFWEVATGQERLAISSSDTEWQSRWNELAFSPDGRTLVATRNGNSLQFWNAATGQEVLRLGPVDARVLRPFFSPDGNLLATDLTDGTILVWDVGKVVNRPRFADRKPDARQLETWWRDLAGSDARKAYAAIWSLAEAPDQGVPFLRDRLKPAAVVSADKLRQLIADLDHSQFARREAAARGLADLEERAEPALQEALKGNVSAEERKRIEAILAAPRTVRSPENLSRIRSIQALEQIGTGPARDLLATLANGAAEARPTRDAKEALERLERKRVGKP